MRTLPLLTLASLLALPLSAKAPLARSYILYVGTYTGPESKGIHAWRFNGGTGRTEALGLVAESPNPSFLALAPGGRFLYAVNELGEYQGQKGGSLSAFAIDRATGKLKSLNEVPSGGAHPCYITLDGTGRNALVANYTGGSVAVFPIGEDGRLGAFSSFIQFTGKGIDPVRQEAPHAHSINLSPDGRFLIAADLGLDKLMVYRFEGRTGKLSPNEIPFARTAPGAGPRHVAFRPDGRFVYVLNELASTISTFAYDARLGTLLERGTVSTLPVDFQGTNTGAEIQVHPSGKFLYASNRGQDGLAVFAVGAEGSLSLVQHVPSGGRTPRYFTTDPSGEFLLAANQDSNNVVVFKVDGKTGRLTATGETLSVPLPVCIQFLPVR